MLTPLHFVWIGLCAVCIAAGLVLARKTNLSMKGAGLCMTAICALSESSKIITHMEPSPLGGFALSPLALPFHLCSMLIFAVLYITFAPDSPKKTAVAQFTAPMGLLGGIAAILIPTDGVDFRDILAYQCFVYHAGLIWFSLRLLLSGQVRLDRKAYGRNVLILFSLALIMVEVNGALSAYGTNFMFVVRPPMEGLPILNLDHGWLCYFLALAGLAILALTLAHLPFLMAERKGQQEDK